MRQDIPPEERESRPDTNPPQGRPKKTKGSASNQRARRIADERMGLDRQPQDKIPVAESAPADRSRWRLPGSHWLRLTSRGRIAVLGAAIGAIGMIVAALIRSQAATTIIIPPPSLPKSVDSTIGSSTPVSTPAPVPVAKPKEEVIENQTLYAPDPNQPDMIRIPGERFRISRCEVSNKQYRLFWLENPEHRPRYYDSPDFNHSSQPVVGVSWYDAAAYCNWLGMKRKEAYRLPTKEEWDKAAEYSGANRYPGGKNEIDKKRVNIGKDRTHPLAVDRPEAETTSLGIRDMTGNVAEWCQDSTPDGKRIVRGGSWASEFGDAAHYSNNACSPGTQTNKDLGFRIVVLDPEYQ